MPSYLTSLIPIPIGIWDLFYKGMKFGEFSDMEILRGNSGENIFFLTNL